MSFASESAFERHIRELISTHVLPNCHSLEVLGGKKGVDLCLVRNGSSSRIFLIEVKYFNKSKNHSMVALGSSDGSGFQPASLLQRPDYLESHMRWVLGTADSSKYYLLSNAQVSRHLSGGSIGAKQNGINRSVFSKEHGLTETQFIDELCRWVRST